MKRSEMVDLLYRHLESYAGMVYHGLNVEDAPEELMKEIEKAGMLPPPKSIVIEYSNQDQLKGLRLYRDECSWEEES